MSARLASAHRGRTAVIVGSAGAAVVAAFVGLGLANIFSSSSCESAQSGAVGVIDDEAGGVACGATDVATDAAEPAAATAGETISARSEPGNASAGPVVAAPGLPAAADPAEVDTAAATPNPASASPAPANLAADSPAPAVVTPAAPAGAKSPPTVPTPTNSSGGVTNKPAAVKPAPGSYSDITTFGLFHGTSSHTHVDSLAGGRTAITTEALVSYNGLRAFLGLGAVELDAIGEWAFANGLTNNKEAYGQDLKGVGLYYGMQGAKVGWIRDDAFDPKLVADIERTARQGDTSAVMAMVETHGHRGYADYLSQSGLVDTFVNTLKMEPHYGGWMHGRVHGGLAFSNGSGAQVATAHDLNHLTVLSHDQTQPYMNDTFDWPQWPALEMPKADVLDYFQSMAVLGDPRGNALP